MALQRSLSAEAILFDLVTGLRPSDESWVAAICSTPMTATSEVVTLSGPGNVPPVEKMRGAREVGELRDVETRILNDTFQSSFRVKHKEQLYSPPQLISSRSAQLLTRWQQHWGDLASVMVNEGALPESLVYDGQPFFSANHSDYRSGTQSNIVPVSGITAPGAPTGEEMVRAIFAGIARMETFRDDHGKPQHRNPRQFLLVHHPTLLPSVAAALGSTQLANGQTNALVTFGGYSFETHSDSRMDAANGWDEGFALFVRDMRSFVRTTVEEGRVLALLGGSDYNWETLGWAFGIHGTRGIQYASWDSAVRVEMST